MQRREGLTHGDYRKALKMQNTT